MSILIGTQLKQAQKRIAALCVWLLRAGWLRFTPALSPQVLGRDAQHMRYVWDHAKVSLLAVGR